MVELLPESSRLRHPRTTLSVGARHSLAIAAVGSLVVTTAGCFTGEYRDPEFTVSDEQDPPNDGGSGGEITDSSPRSSPMSDESDASTPDSSADSGTQDRCPLGFTGSDCEKGAYLDITAGGYHTCAVRETGAVECWGNDEYGQVSGAPGSHDFVRVEAGATFSCGLKQDGTAECWGPPGMQQVPDGIVEELVAGEDAACVRRPSGYYNCWGNDESGTYSGRPEEPVLSLALGPGYGCAILLDESILCWGDDSGGQTLGVSETGFKSLHLGKGFGAARRTDGTLAWWGMVPQRGYTEFVFGVDVHGLKACGILEDEWVLCWFPTYASSGPAKKVTLGVGHHCLLLTDDSIACFGSNAHGQETIPPP